MKAYPKELLPRFNYKIITSNVNEFYLARFTKDSDYWDYSFNRIKEDSIKTAQSVLTQLPDFSTSLYSIFKEEHIFYIVTKAGYNDYCKLPIHINKIRNSDFNIANQNSRFCWYVDISILHNKEVNFINNKDNIPVKMTAICKILHTPTYANFWHFSINWWIVEWEKYWHEFPDSKKRQGWSKALKAAAIALIQKASRQTSKTNYPKLLKKNYKRNLFLGSYYYLKNKVSKIKL